MLASGPLYASGTFWTVVGVIVGIASVIAAIGIWRIGTPRRLLLYSMPLVASLLSRSLAGRTNKSLRLTYLGDEIEDPYAVVLRVESKSRRDISSADFDQGKPLLLDVGAQIVAIIGGSQEVAIPAENIVVEGNVVKLMPALIRKGVVIRLTLLLNGPPHLVPSSPLIDTEIRQRDLKVPKWLGAALAFSIALMIFLGIRAVGSTTHPSSLVAAAIGFATGIVSAVGWGVLIDILRGRMTRRGV